MQLRDDPMAEIRTWTDPERSHEVLLFTCPRDGCTLAVRFTRDQEPHALDDDRFVWRASGLFPDTFTLTPSVDVKECKGGPSHWHGHVTGGNVG